MRGPPFAGPGRLTSLGEVRATAAHNALASDPHASPGYRAKALAYPGQEGLKGWTPVPRPGTM